MSEKILSFTLACAAALAFVGCTTNKGIDTMDTAKEEKASISVSPFGKTIDGRATKIYHLVGAGGVIMDITDYGARAVRIFTPDKNGQMTDITLGFDDVQNYETVDRYFGSTIGRVGNRIKDGKFTLDGKTYSIPCNNDPGNIPCSLHGGDKGYDSIVWDSKPIQDGDNVGIVFTAVSPDGDQGYPGTVNLKVTHWLTADNVWRIEYEATTDKATPINLTNHVYFNLKGQGNGNILDHELTLFADQMTPINVGMIPTGKLADVKGTPFDFTTPWKIGARIETKNEQLKFGNGYDHNFVLRNQSGKLAPAASLYESTTGRSVDVWTDQPGIQFYCGNFLNDKVPAKGGKKLCYRGGLALETQHFPDSPNKPEFPSVILRPGAVYKTATEYRFGTK